MIFIKGNLLDSDAHALVNTVNTVGVMGKGIALQFKEAFPINFNVYIKSCKEKWLVPGKLLVVHEGEKIIINFPTKTEWNKKSQYEYIESGLIELVSVIQHEKIKSIAIPPLGCGNGGLQWDKVKSLITKYLADLNDIDIFIYEPNNSLDVLLKKENVGKEVRLTPARAMLLYSMFYYESLGEHCSLFVANKLAYFLRRLGEKSFSKLDFQAHLYGPYCVGVEHVLQNLNGKYIKGLEQMKVRTFEPLELQYDTVNEVSDYVKKELTTEQINIIKNMTMLIDGFQSALSIEVLASVDFVLKNNPNFNSTQLIETIQKWSKRKSKLFEEKYISIAVNHLIKYQEIMPIS